MAISRRTFGKLLGAVGVALGAGFVPLEADSRASILASLQPYLGTHEFRQRIPKENSHYGGVICDDGDIRQQFTGLDTATETPLAATLAGCLLQSKASAAFVIVGPGLAKEAELAKSDLWIQSEGIQIVIEESQPDRDVFIVSGLTRPIESLDDIDPKGLARITMGHHGPFVGAKREDYPSAWNTRYHNEPQNDFERWKRLTGSMNRKVIMIADLDPPFAYWRGGEVVRIVEVPGVKMYTFPVARNGALVLHGPRGSSIQPNASFDVMEGRGRIEAAYVDGKLVALAAPSTSPAVLRYATEDLGRWVEAYRPFQRPNGAKSS